MQLVIISAVEFMIIYMYLKNWALPTTITQNTFVHLIFVT